jgi:uncharacterized protein YgiM (DUF1202 family)
VDGTIDERNPQWGWQDYGLTRQQYADQLEENHNLLAPNVVAMLPFTTDFQGREWRGYNTTPAHNQILAWALAYKGKDMKDVHDVFPTKRTGTVTAHALNVRDCAGIRCRIVRTLARGAKVNIFETRPGFDITGAHRARQWMRIGHDEWVAGEYVEEEEEEMEKKTGTVTANVLNVRVEPAIKARNVGTLRTGAKVFITQEHVKPDGTVWYKIGFNRWVHGGWVKLDEKGSRTSLIV